MLCPSCGADNPGHAKFCLECGSSLEAPTADPGTERKVVSVLFCDLVGFTSRSETADPEDVLATVRPYHALLRTDIEGYGGTVEKFIGDAVMAVFGAPVAHEDDPERAVRAGLRILETLKGLKESEGLDLSVRIGINTGEAIVALGARPESGEGMVTGDVVNTAARIQTGAPVGGIAVGETTYRSTKDVIDYEPLEPITAKGKAEPVPAWRALSARARFGTDLTRTHTTPLVGREAERMLLRSLFERAVRDRSCQLVTIMGEPGVGKSRMVTELFSHIDDEREELITWRQGRCLPYGDGIAFWALGEIVKAHAGILESDSVEEVGAKLIVRSAALVRAGNTMAASAPVPLVGAGPAGRAGGRSRRGAGSWRRCPPPRSLRLRGPAWADPAMLASRAPGRWSRAPMLVIGTARQSSRRRTRTGGEVRNATTVNPHPCRRRPPS
jgi:class 3 adenylate cyclase